MDYTSILQDAGRRYNVDPLLAQAVLTGESNGNPNALSSKGASGLMQLMPETAKAMGVTDINDPVQNIHGGIKYISQLLDKYGNVPTALAAYNAGPGAVDKHNGIPPFPETQNYVKTVSNRYQSLQGKPMAQNFPGLPPEAPAASSGEMVDPFAGLLKEKTPQASVANSGTVDPFAGLDGETERSPTVIRLDGMAPSAKEPTLYDMVERQFGLTTRAAINAATGLPTMAGDAMNSALNLGVMGVNKLAGTHISPLEMPSNIVQKAIDASGIPKPEGTQENIVQGISGGMGAAGPGVALGKALGKYSAPAVKAIGDGLASLPGMQVFGGAGAGAGGSIAKEADLGPMGQIGAALAGGLAGAVAPSAAIATARGVGNTVRGVQGAVMPVVAPQKFVGQQLAAALGYDAQKVAENIRTAPQYVPGSQPTTAQAGGTPMLVATEKSAANADPNFKIALAGRDAENNSARWDALYGVAKTPADLAEAVIKRRTDSAPLFDQAHQSTAPITQGFLNVSSRPAMVQAMKEADILARNEGKTFQWPTPENPVIDGAALDYTTRALSNMIGKAKSSNAPQEAAAYQGIKNYLKNWAETNIPKVAEARAAYRDMSAPVNTMTAAQQMAEALANKPLNANREPQITVAGYQTAMARALKAQKYGIDPEAENLLSGIGSDLQRGTVSNSLKSPGSDTAYNISADGWLARQIYGKDYDGASMLAKGLGAVGATATGHPFVGLGILGGGKKLGEAVGSSLNKQLADLLLHPEMMLPYLDAAGKKTPQALAKALRGNVSQGAIGTALATSPKP